MALNVAQEPVYVQWRTGERLSKVHVKGITYGSAERWVSTRCGLHTVYESIWQEVDRGPNPCRLCLAVLAREMKKHPAANPDASSEVKGGR